MKQPFLVIMAAGMGSRFGGLKQITPVDDQGHMIIDFSLYDAKRAGFQDVVFVIKHEIEEAFKQTVGRRMEQQFCVHYVYQEVDSLPDGFTVPEGRKKPWGTGHAVACCAEALGEHPFAVVNSDDFYGTEAYEKIYQFLKEDRAPNEHAMVGYLLKNAVTKNGSVARGICTIDPQGFLADVQERTRIEQRPDSIAFTEDGEHFVPLSPDTIVSMNFWGFGSGMLQELVAGFPHFLREQLPENPVKCEYFLPAVADKHIKQGRGTVQVLRTDESWYGVTYHEDLESVRQAIAQLKQAGRYPTQLWK